MSADGKFRAGLARPETLLFIVLVIAVTLMAFWPSWSGLTDIWNSDANTYSHGYLIAAICAATIVRAAARAKSGATLFDRLWLVPAFVAGGIWIVAYLSTVQLVQALVVPCIVLCVLLAVFGTRSAPLWAFPVGFFYFSVPIWDYLNPILLRLTIAVNQTVLHAARIPVQIDAEFVHLAGGSFEIADGCSGLHFLVVMLALAVAYLHLNRCSPARSILIFLLSLVGALVLNWIRVSSIIIVGHISDMQHYLIVEDHYVYGWLLFVAMAILLYWLAERLAGSGLETSGTSPAASSDVSPIARVPAVLALLVLCAGPAFALALDWRSGKNVPATLTAPQSIGPWQLDVGHDPHWSPNYAGAQSEILATYRRGDSSISLYASQYAIQSQGRELINATNSLYRTNEWRRTAVERLELDLGNGESAPVQMSTIANSMGSEAILFHWFIVGDMVTIDALAVKREELKLRFLGRPSSSIVAIRVNCEESCNRARTEGLAILHRDFESLARRMSQQ